ncbi:GTPase HflX [Desulforhopalus vacuolatus]|uniref:GTPase HflX n=1 Tax=Desulforhopalus vacuolatus TaxID=40414 RepID=UPI001965B446|nr:GTPase HflX [Desulforhopalus vacuolatus]MBM9520634.1 GTPase HflX [Desulforhopalus vacuolatus]
MARTLAELSFELNRQLGLLINRAGKVEMLIVGDYAQIVIPSLGNIRAAGGRLRGLRLVHTHLGGEMISEEDLMDLLFLRLDLLSMLEVGKDGLPRLLHTVHLLPEVEEGRGWSFLTSVHPAQQKDSAEELIAALEGEFSRVSTSRRVESKGDRAILVSVSTEPRLHAEESLTELAELARSAEVEVLDQVLQRRRKINPRLILGKGKLAEIMILALQLNANLLIFDEELNPSQIRSITNFTDMRVIDRTQLILDIFARRATSREGKLQVEMAQLKYMLPRLSSRDDALSRLTGGIGARGPGETKLEIDRRRINDRLARLARELKQVSLERYRRRGQRRKRDLPVLSLVGYTNAGKSTLLNTLTKSDIYTEDQLFATLDPTSRRMRFPTEMEVILTDTVGFIRHLPADLMQAFMATLEELQEADLLVHVVDVSNSLYREHMQVVEDILQQLDLGSIPVLKLFNKIDLVEDRELLEMTVAKEGLLVSAQHPETLESFLLEAERYLGGKATGL